MATTKRNTSATAKMVLIGLKASARMALSSIVSRQGITSGYPHLTSTWGRSYVGHSSVACGESLTNPIESTEDAVTRGCWQRSDRQCWTLHVCLFHQVSSRNLSLILVTGTTGTQFPVRLFSASQALALQKDVCEIDRVSPKGCN